ncbi:MAG: ribose 5-phosphate isomerase B [Nitrospirae bacterium]|nr:ribose 5-phosphate isomerase B [Candidatus Manganitrophaceae bacterium]
MKTVVIGSDHAGLEAKEFIKKRLEKWDYRVEDAGPYRLDPADDYPDYVEKVALKVLEGRGRRGVLSCGTGIGASIAANKIPGIRAALVSNVEEARLSRAHNDANLLVLRGWGYDQKELPKILKAWLEGKFEGGRHRRRVSKITAIEKKYLSACPEDSEDSKNSTEKRG